LRTIQYLGTLLIYLMGFSVAPVSGPQTPRLQGSSFGDREGPQNGTAGQVAGIRKGTKRNPVLGVRVRCTVPYYDQVRKVQQGQFRSPRKLPIRRKHSGLIDWPSVSPLRRLCKGYSFVCSGLTWVSSISTATLADSLLLSGHTRDRYPVFPYLKQRFSFKYSLRSSVVRCGVSGRRSDVEGLAG